jgi:hypothetical protein
MARKTTTLKAARPKNMNPRVTLRASTIPNRKRLASKLACRSNRKALD